jgi:hypothetical protein
MESQWINPKERLPEYEVHVGGIPFVCVLVCVNDTLISEGMYINGEWEVLGVRTDKVTHWMPLPSPPKIKESGEIKI